MGGVELIINQCYPVTNNKSCHVKYNKKLTSNQIIMFAKMGISAE